MKIVAIGALYEVARDEEHNGVLSLKRFLEGRT